MGPSAEARKKFEQKQLEAREFTAETLRKGERYRVRDHYICALLHTVPPGARSDAASVFVWDTVARLMEMRERDLGRITPELIKDFIDAPPAPPETDAQKIERLQNELLAKGIIETVFPKPETPEHDDGPF
jgi:hypothetical protein